MALGLTGAWALGRALDAFLFRVSGADPVSFAAAIAVAALAATLLPAVRAAKVSPAAALR
ncbi:MAG: hypothetical protein IT178_00580 [Acidobacteria bacterium]|nr:hypothetical protein [Acidobacteriota bacterium]